MSGAQDFPRSGLSADELFTQAEALTFDDVIVLPANFTPLVEHPALTTEVAKGFPLKLPLVSSPMDTVTGSAMAKKMALHGGLGVIHRYFQDRDGEIGEVRSVKRHEMLFITKPLVADASQTVGWAREVKKKHGFSTIPVTGGARLDSPLEGLVTDNDLWEQPDDRCLFDVMTHFSELVTRTKSQVQTREQAVAFFRSHPTIDKLLIVNDEVADEDDPQARTLWALVTRDDLRRATEPDYPHALRDRNGQLRVGVAISTEVTKDNLHLLEALLAEGVDLFCTDTAHGGRPDVVEIIRRIRKLDANIPILAGNVICPEQAVPLLDAGATGLRVGMGSGSICTTQRVIRTGGGQLSDVYRMAKFARRYGVPVISDGGIRNTGDMVAALSVGASAVMCGNFLAGCDESPGETFMDPVKGLRKKRYRGMGSLSVQREHQSARSRYRGTPPAPTEPLVEHGVDGAVLAKGSLDKILPEVAAALRDALVNHGCQTIAELHTKLWNGDLRFMRQSPAARLEGQPHDIL